MKTFIGIDERLPLGMTAIYGLQHVLAMFAGIIAVPLIVSNALGLPAEQTTVLIQGALIASGIGTLVQCLGVGRLGARLPICMGTAFVFIAPMISIGKNLGIQAIFGAVIVGGILEFLASFVIWRVKDFFPPLVTGTVVSLIGLGLVPLGFRWAAGGYGPLFGQPLSFLISGLVLVLILAINRLSKGFLASIAVVLAIAVGYLVAGGLGFLNLAGVREAQWIAFPKVFWFGPPTFSLAAIMALIVAQFASMLETVGDTFATGTVAKKEISGRELAGAISVDGLLSSIASVVNGFSITSFSQNIGVIGITGVASRFAVAAGGIILIILGLVPKIAAVVAAMPDPVLGGAALVMFGAIAGAGINQLREVQSFTQRDLIVFSTAIALGLGFALHPEGALDNIPRSIATILESGVAVGGISAIILDQVIPKKDSQCET